jgi:proteasome activator subunit 4
MSTAMFVIQSVISIMIDDLTRPEVQSIYDEKIDVDEQEQRPLVGEGEEGEEPKLTKREEDEAARMSTAGFPDWVSNFFRQVLVVFEALPEPGKNNRNGGKMEDQMTQTLIVSSLAPTARRSANVSN